MARTPQYYHHGKSPMAWAAAGIAARGFIIAAAGSLMGPHWALVITGGVIVAIAAVLALVMKAMGYGQP